VLRGRPRDDAPCRKLFCESAHGEATPHVVTGTCLSLVRSAPIRAGAPNITPPDPGPELRQKVSKMSDMTVAAKLSGNVDSAN
jgi:hypothetical protein